MTDNTEHLQTSRRNHPEGLAAASALHWDEIEMVAAEGDEKKQDNNGKEESDLDEIHYVSATTLAALIRAGDVSPVGLIDMTLKRLKNRDNEINAFVTVTGQRARKAAKEAERAVENGEELGPLHGIPIAVKDLQPVKGVRWTSGVLPLADRVADETEIVVKRLFDAGAILIGKTNTPEYGYPGKTDSLLTGATSTPFDLDSNSGGSSGGSASAVASGIVPIATGTDGAGSIRIPASFCSVYGFKSTYRRLPDPTVFATGTTFKSNGAETRTVRDAALALSVMAGPSDTPKDPYILPTDDMNYLEAVDRGVEDMSVGYSSDLGVYPVDYRVRNVVGESVKAISYAGATVEPVDVDLGVTYDELISSLRIMRGAAYSTLPEKLAMYDIDVLGADRDKFPDKLIEFIEFGREKISMVDLKRNDETVRTSVFNGIQSVFEDYDILVTPTVAVPPFPNSIAGPSEINGVEIDPILGWLITAVFNMTGNPAASIPAGFTGEGLPVGMQLVGERLGDESVLAASAAYERVNPWHENYKAITQTPDEKIKTGKENGSSQSSVSENTTAQDRMTAECGANQLERSDG